MSCEDVFVVAVELYADDEEAGVEFEEPTEVVAGVLLRGSKERVTTTPAIIRATAAAVANARRPKPPRPLRINFEQKNRVPHH